jgi:rhamnosyltransferase
VIVVEDGTNTLDTDALSGTAKLIRMTENSGIAAALNTGISIALSTETSADAFIMTLDQDSELGPYYVENAFDALERAASAGCRVGSVAPAYHNGVPMRRVATGTPGVDEVFDPMQSGTIYPAATFHEVGLLEEDFFIDAVDTEFNLRMKAAGLLTVAADRCDLIHELGATRPLRIFGWQPSFRGRRMVIHYHAPFRTYYITRNQVTLWQRYLRRFPAWMLRRGFLEVESAAVCLIFGPSRLKHVRATAAGLRDGARKRLGRISDQLRSRLAG